jgi:integrase
MPRKSILLPNNCRASELKVTPSNWNTNKADTAKDWVIHYRFYDPSRSQPHQKLIRGMNDVKDRKERQMLTKSLIENELTLLHAGYNPFASQIIPEKNIEYSGNIAPTTQFIESLRHALDKVTCTHNTRIDIRSVIKGTEAAAVALRFEKLEIRLISRKHIKLILEYCAKHNPRFSARRHNMYRAYLMKLFHELVEIEACDYNPVRDIRKQKQTNKIRRYITMEELVRVITHLEKVTPRFALFVKLFYFSGARKTELFKLKVKDVNLHSQYFRTTVMKGKVYREVDRTINNNALQLWNEVIGSASPEQFVFSKNLLPGDKAIRPDQIHRRWHRYVRNNPKAKHGKHSIGIDVDFNTIRHLALDQITAQESMEAAASQAGHTTTDMVAKVYAINEKTRRHQKMKEINLRIG